ncbi:hypothetical protein C453_17534 [Haloferax elongans ATCC BAA-1513]|uniref:Uncharacterized protein n=1 Tax=Haloferax elongans ATCC BAA-1513 TaxID=1230453 RepID=M0HBB0_HALEO|nr:DUF5810 domain-containing protein [Haloferax elongans]ELZ81841.1 hypothetical protein C453_17534 [Haloferax elongans ATCC BAA-1513]
MGYACPVCDAPQRDETHLANHLALQAIVHGDDHETWLDEHEPSWASMNPDTLGPLVADEAEEREFDEVFEDTVDRRESRPSPFDDGHGHEHMAGHDHDHTHSHDHGRQQFGGGGEPNLTGDAARIFEEARAMTEEMRAGEDEGDEAAASGGDDATDSAGDESGSDGDDAPDEKES